MTRIPPTKQWTLDAEAFENLLASLDPDRERAAERYELVRAKLISFFEYRGASHAEDLADETLDRVARRLEEGVAVPPAELRSYIFGVARNVLREAWHSTDKSGPLDDLPPSREPSYDPRAAAGPDEEARLECLTQCLAALGEEDRDLIRAYHTADGRDRVEGRKELGERLGIGLNALRIRAYRIRRDLERCMEKCMRGHA
jgi:DNA-directed RNA polymerase specialized sigma24 family protein